MEKSYPEMLHLFVAERFPEPSTGENPVYAPVFH